VWRDATAQLLTTSGAIFLCTFILLSFDLYTALIVTTLIAIIIIDMVGIMVLWDIELNAISLVNLVIVSFDEGFSVFTVLVHSIDSNFKNSAHFG
jgi:Niemann-Pick C1 protein